MSKGDLLVFAVLILLLIGATGHVGIGSAAAQDALIATVNGKPITENDMRLGQLELGNELDAIAPENRRGVVLEYLIETPDYVGGCRAGKD